MTLDKLWESIFKFDTYEKGGEYSASDIVGDIMATKLRSIHKTTDIKYIDRISSFVGTAIHERIEKWVQSENDFDETNMQSEVKLKYKNLSGTADLIIDGCILDFKTGKESSIKVQIKNPVKWIQQVSIYSFLYAKEKKQPMNTIGYIAWLCTDTQKHGILELELLSEDETIKLIKDFMTEIDKPIEELPKCDLCIQFKHRWCGVKSFCPYWKVDDDFSSIDDW